MQSAESRPDTQQVHNQAWSPFFHGTGVLTWKGRCAGPPPPLPQAAPTPLHEAGELQPQRPHRHMQVPWPLTWDLNTQHQALRQTHAHLKPTRLSHVPLILRVITSQLLFLEHLYPPPPSPSGKAAWRERDTVVQGWGGMRSTGRQILNRRTTREAPKGNSCHT